MNYGHADCRECGTQFKRTQRRGMFCSHICRAKWNNRRQARGAELYDIVMARGARDPLVGELLRAYKTADAELRSGRPSYQDIELAILALPRAYGRGGDTR